MRGMYVTSEVTLSLLLCIALGSISGCKTETAYTGPKLADSQTATVIARNDKTSIFPTNLVIIENDSLAAKSEAHNERLSPIKVLPGMTRAALYWGHADEQSVVNKLTSIAATKGLCIVSFNAEAGRTYYLQISEPPESVELRAEHGASAMVKCQQAR